MAGLVNQEGGEEIRLGIQLISKLEGGIGG